MVHDYLNQYGGGERVLEALMEIFPEAPVYTLLHDQERTGGRFSGRVIKTSFLDFPFARKNHRLFIPLMPFAARSLNLKNDYELIISDTAGFAKGIKYSPSTRHISYIHTPLRYAWETDYLNFKFSRLLGGQAIFNFQFWKHFFKPVLNYLKKWDYRAAQKPDILTANSEFISGKIKQYYHRDAKVLYPPVDVSKFYFETKSKLQNPNNKYYLAVGRLLHYKKFDLIIDAFAESQMANNRLLIVGSGPEYDNLKFKIKNLRLNNVELLPFVNDENELRKLYNGAQALIFPQVEDFGLVAAEAQACGTPVIAYGVGGAVEIISDPGTGVLFHEQTPKSLIQAVEICQKRRFNRAAISRSAQRFSKDKFKKGILTLLGSLGYTFR